MWFSTRLSPPHTFRYCCVFCFFFCFFFFAARRLIFIRPHNPSATAKAPSEKSWMKRWQHECFTEVASEKNAWCYPAIKGWGSFAPSMLLRPCMGRIQCSRWIGGKLWIVVNWCHCINDNDANHKWLTLAFRSVKSCEVHRLEIGTKAGATLLLCETLQLHRDKSVAAVAFIPFSNDWPAPPHGESAVWQIWISLWASLSN